MTTLRAWITALTVAAVACLALPTAAGARPARAARIVPVFAQQLWGPLAQYRTDVRDQLSAISSELPGLLSAEQAGDIAAARQQWLAPHLTWLLIGQDDGAYGAFGALGRAIDGTAAGDVHGVHSSSFTGFHRIEYELFTADDITAAAQQTVTLEGLIARLRRIGMVKELPGRPTALQNWVLRAHEILEDADRDTLTGDDDEGSGTGVASVTADAEATAEILSLLKPVIAPRAPGLVGRCERDLRRILRVARGTEVHGSWVAIDRLPVTEREQLDAAVGEAVENLAPISDIIHVLGAKL